MMAHNLISSCNHEQCQCNTLSYKDGKLPPKTSTSAPMTTTAATTTTETTQATVETTTKASGAAGLALISGVGLASGMLGWVL